MGIEKEPVTVINSLNDLVEKLHELFENDLVNVEEVKYWMDSYKSNPQDWKRYAKFDALRYTRNLVDEGNGKFNLMALCWGEGHGSSIHDHSSAHCFMKILDGSITESQYDWPTESQGDQASMVVTRVAEYEKNQCAYINDSMGLHRVENKSHSNKAVSLHLYSPPFESCQIFDEHTGRKSCAKVTFWSKYGDRTIFTAANNECSNIKP